MPAREWRRRPRKQQQHQENMRKLLSQIKGRRIPEDRQTGNMIQGKTTARFIGKNGAQKELLLPSGREGKLWGHLLE